MQNGQVFAPIGIEDTQWGQSCSVTLAGIAFWTALTIRKSTKAMIRNVTSAVRNAPYPISPSPTEKVRSEKSGLPTIAAISHDHVVDQRGDYCSEGHAKHESHGQLDEVALQREFLEI